jgi:hypothetical protein
MAIITDSFKKRFIQNLLDDIADSAQHYYIGIGRSEQWDSFDAAPTATNSILEERNFRLSLQSIKKAEDVSYVIPRYNWTSGTIYSAWNNSQAGYPTNSYYVITDENQIYICLEQGKNSAGAAVASTVKPSGFPSTPFRTADGYIWKFLYTMAVVQANNFLSANYMPVSLIDSDTGVNLGSPAAYREQYGIQKAAIPGTISNITVTAGGTGYTSAPAVTIVGDGDSAQGVATISSGAVVKVEMKDSAASILYYPGHDYHYADVVFTGGGGTGATARVNISPQNGFGADPRIDLKSTAIMFNTKPNGAENDDFIVGQDFRQVGIIRNPLDSADVLVTTSTASALNYMTVSSISNNFTADKIIEGGTSGARAYVDRFDTDTIYYHQTTETGFIPFQVGETVSETNGSGSATIATTANPGDINKFTGEIFYIDNRAAIERSAAQTEDLKVIIQL